MSNIKSHFHITLGGITSKELDIAAKKVKCKPTNIDLILSQSEYRDRMITGYQLGIGLDKLTTIKFSLERNGYNVLRYKLEADLFSYLKYLGNPDFKKSYIEAHFHIEKKSDVDEKIFSFSKNPASNGKIFANYRGYSEDDMNFIIEYTKEKENCHLELCLFDSNINHDNFWWNKL